MRIKPTLTTIIVTLLIFLWAYSAASKFFEYDIFTAQLRKHDLLRKHADLIAILVPIVESLIVVALLLPLFRIPGLYCSLFLLLIFTTYIIYILSSYSAKPCPCGGFISLMGWKTHVFFNLFFGILASIGIWLEQKQRKL